MDHEPHSFRGLEYDFVLAPYADASRIQLTLHGTTGLTLLDTAELRLNTPAGTVTQARPIAFQEIDGQRRQVEIIGGCPGEIGLAGLATI